MQTVELGENAKASNDVEALLEADPLATLTMITLQMDVSCITWNTPVGKRSRLLNKVVPK